ncbi:Pentapeptide repeats (9 copies) [Dyadobacter sp. SG02]|uniref:pentapeptide repeat-containing protein n=1 Tax=Dyadobacter sp. SG02 TaxID=1855291 RepID=UPI0008CF3531|nr:pentapeptide repeat-containing protein [Dyadobacter sp. SG02]SEJ82747.1 Pentapeptide repeats (9 copies) [Dyadobacter sp. SG02]
METIKQISLDSECVVITAHCVMLSNSTFNDVNMSNISITDANLSDLQIEGAQLGGAVFQNIGMAPPDHPMYDPNAEQRPLLFEHSDLHKSQFIDCDLSGVAITSCNIEGMTIDGISVSELLKNHF